MSNKALMFGANSIYFIDSVNDSDGRRYNIFLIIGRGPAS